MRKHDTQNLLNGNLFFGWWCGSSGGRLDYQKKFSKSSPTWRLSQQSNVSSQSAVVHTEMPHALQQTVHCKLFQAPAVAADD